VTRHRLLGVVLAAAGSRQIAALATLARRRTCIPMVPRGRCWARAMAGLLVV